MKYDVDILHTGDWHLWHKHKYTRLMPGRHYDYMHLAKMDVLQETFLNYVKKNKVRLFYIAGDVFEHYNPIEPIRTDFIRLVFEISKHVEKVEILMGNHDTYKGEQPALESFQKAFRELNSNIYIYLKDYFTSDIYFGHRGVEGFEARSGFYEKPDRVTPTSFFKDFKLVLLGHYHKSQNKGKIIYCGSPYPVNFGEQESKFFNVVRPDMKINRYRVNGIKFCTNPKVGDLKGSKYAVVRLREEVTPDKEKEVRKKLLEKKAKIMEADNVLDVIIDITVLKGSIDPQGKHSSVSNYRDLIKETKADKSYIDYIFKKFDEVEVE